MKIEFDENGKFELEINCVTSLLFEKDNEGNITVEMPVVISKLDGKARNSEKLLLGDANF